MSLSDRLKALIASDGPIPVSTWMSLCLHDPDEGYYASRPGLGRDFATAPEISQVFGELLGVWVRSAQQDFEPEAPPYLAELGPGSGVLMSDILRILARQVETSDFPTYLVEASPILKAQQQARLAPYHPVHVDGLDALPDRPAIIVANEFLDCLPARQFVDQGGTWAERVIGLSETGDFQFGLAVDRAPDSPPDSVEGEVELQPGLDQIADLLAARTAPFRALFIDYGPDGAAPSDSLRAFRGGQQVSVLDQPGSADLTVDVDFARLKRLAETANLDVAGPVTQGSFLAALGVEQRLQQLINANPDRAQDIFDRVAKLAEPDKMGTRFKVICLSSRGLPHPIGF